jgi:hypothetical protein
MRARGRNFSSENLIIIVMKIRNNQDNEKIVKIARISTSFSILDSGEDRYSWSG